MTIHQFSILEQFEVLIPRVFPLLKLQREIARILPVDQGDDLQRFQAEHNVVGGQIEMSEDVRFVLDVFGGHINFVSYSSIQRGGITNPWSPVVLCVSFLS